MPKTALNFYPIPTMCTNWQTTPYPYAGKFHFYPLMNQSVLAHDPALSQAPHQQPYFSGTLPAPRAPTTEHHLSQNDD